MIAVAVAMSVIIFVWSQGFLAGTSESTGSQQGAQNQAAQSSISIETVLTTPSGAAPTIKILIRNVGAVAIDVGTVTVTGISSNAMFTGSLIGSSASDTHLSMVISDSVGNWTGTGGDLQSLQKAAGTAIALTGSSLTGVSTTRVASGDVLTVKVTTKAGTFAQQTYTVP